MENQHAINGKIHYFDWAIFNSYVWHNQRVYIYVPTDVFAPEGTLIFYLKILILVRNIHQSSSG